MSLFTKPLPPSRLPEALLDAIDAVEIDWLNPSPASSTARKLLQPCSAPSARPGSRRQKIASIGNPSQAKRSGEIGDRPPPSKAAPPSISTASSRPCAAGHSSFVLPSFIRISGFGFSSFFPVTQLYSPPMMPHEPSPIPARKKLIGGSAQLGRPDRRHGPPPRFAPSASSTQKAEISLTSPPPVRQRNLHRHALGPIASITYRPQARPKPRRARGLFDLCRPPSARGRLRHGRPPPQTASRRRLLCKMSRHQSASSATTATGPWIPPFRQASPQSRERGQVSSPRRSSNTTSALSHYLGSHKSRPGVSSLFVHRTRHKRESRCRLRPRGTRPRSSSAPPQRAKPPADPPQIPGGGGRNIWAAGLSWLAPPKNFARSRKTASIGTISAQRFHDLRRPPRSARHRRFGSSRQHEAPTPIDLPPPPPARPLLPQGRSSAVCDLMITNGHRARAHIAAADWTVPRR